MVRYGCHVFYGMAIELFLIDSNLYYGSLRVKGINRDRVKVTEPRIITYARINLVQVVIPKE